MTNTEPCKSCWEEENKRFIDKADKVVRSEVERVLGEEVERLKAIIEGVKVIESAEINVLQAKLKMAEELITTAIEGDYLDAVLVEEAKEILKKIKETP